MALFACPCFSSQKLRLEERAFLLQLPSQFEFEPGLVAEEELADY